MDPNPGSTLQTKWAFAAENPDELTIEANSLVSLVERKDDWLLVREISSGRQGLIPMSYTQVVDQPTPSTAASPPKKAAPTVPPKQFKTSPSKAPATNISSNTNQSKGLPKGASASQFRLPPITSTGPFNGANVEENQSMSTSSPQPFQKENSSDDIAQLEQAFANSRTSPTKAQKQSSFRVPIPTSNPQSQTINPIEANPFELLHQQTSGRSLPSVGDTAEESALAAEVTSRLQALKSRINALDSNVLEAEVVPLPPKPKVMASHVSSSSVASASSYPALARPASIVAMEEEERRRKLQEQRLLEEQKMREMEELREKERLRLQWESEQRAMQQQREAQEAEIRRRQAQQEEFDRVRRNSAVLTSKATPEARFMLLANEKLKTAVVHENNRRIPEAVADYVKVLNYMQEAFERNQVMEKAENLARMEEIVEKLSAPPFSNNGSFQGKVGVLAAMSRFGYDLLQRALQLRTQGRTLEEEKNITGAIKLYKAAVEYFIAYKKAGDAIGKPVDPSVMAATEELLTHAELLHRLVS